MVGIVTVVAMSKDIAKLREDLKNDFLQLKEDLKQEMKTAREFFEREMRNELRELRSEQKEVIKSLENAHETIEDLKKQLAAETTKNAELKNENNSLQNRCASVKNKNEELEKRVVHMEQYSRNSNLEIRGVVEEEGEKVADLLAKIGDAIHEPITEQDIETCHRVPTRIPDKTNIVVQFRSRAKRDVTLRKARKARLSNKDIGLHTTEPIYINEHLCPALKKLLGMTTKRRYECSWKSVWTQNGKIFARRTDDSASIQISSEHDLSKIN